MDEKEQEDKGAPDWVDEGVDEGVGDEQPIRIPGFGDIGSLLRPIHNRKIWFTLLVIFLVIAVSVLYVYQAGDRKTILGNQPIPAGQNNSCPLASAAM